MMDDDVADGASLAMLIAVGVAREKRDNVTYHRGLDGCPSESSAQPIVLPLQED